MTGALEVDSAAGVRGARSLGIWNSLKKESIRS